MSANRKAAISNHNIVVSESGGLMIIRQSDHIGIPKKVTVEGGQIIQHAFGRSTVIFERIPPELEAHLMKATHVAYGVVSEEKGGIIDFEESVPLEFV
jgi:hypothetical protein